MTRWNKVRAVAMFEFLSAVRSKGYLILTFGMPVFLLLYGGLLSIPALLAARKERQAAVYGIVDEARMLAVSGETPGSARALPEEIRAALRDLGQESLVHGPLAWRNNLVFRPFAAEAASREALREGRIRGYFVIPPDYIDTGVVDQYSGELPDPTGSESREAVRELLLDRLVRDRVSGTLAERIRTPVRETWRFTLTGTGEVRREAGVAKAVRLLLPIAFAILLLLSILMSAGTLIQATAIEKENKVVEVLLSSADAHEIVTGKLLGLGAAGMLQMVVWLGMAGVSGLAFMGTLAAIGVELPWAAMLAAAGLFPLAYLFFGSLMVGTGSIGSNQREANQWGMAWAMLAVVPVPFLESLLHDPHGVAGHVLSWLPFAAPITLVVRLSVDPGGVAWWEATGSVLLLVASTWLALRLGARLFRVGILLSGARPRLREILRQARLGS